ncbi:hypothetical protein IAT38_004060 [Cryptococcus sp. DSM 104549]
MDAPTPSHLADEEASLEKGDVVDGHFTVEEAAIVDWTPQEERRAFWKQTFIVMPLIMLAFYSLQLDRGNYSQALTGTLFKDVGITQDIGNNGQSLLLVMIVLGEIPSNLILIRLGAKWWLGTQMVLWGIVATAQCAIRSPGAFYATRILLGICESGFIPGGAYYISTMYTHKEQAKLIAWFYIGNICGKGSSGLLASKFLTWQGRGGLPGWAWIFLVEGCMSIGIGFICLIFLPTSIKNSRTLLGFNIFTEREAHILHTRVILDDPLKADPKSHFTKKNVLVALTSWRLWIHSLYCIAGIACVTAVGTYNAQVIKALGFSGTKANAMSSVGAWLQAPCTLFFGYAMDRTRYKGTIVIGIVSIMLILNGSYFALISRTGAVNKWSKFALYELLVGFGEPFAVSGLWWVMATARTPLQRSMFSAMFVMSSNSGQAIGGQMFRAKDAPKYITGFSACLGVYGVCFLICVFQVLQYAYSNKHGLGDSGKEAVTRLQGEGEHAQEEAEVKRVFTYPL